MCDFQSNALSIIHYFRSNFLISSLFRTNSVSQHYIAFLSRCQQSISAKRDRGTDKGGSGIESDDEKEVVKRFPIDVSLEKESHIT